MADITLTWHEAHAAVLAWAHELPIYRGTGAPPPHAHVVVTHWTPGTARGKAAGLWSIPRPGSMCVPPHFLSHEARITTRHPAIGAIRHIVWEEALAASHQ
jgi:hypothetical protein